MPVDVQSAVSSPAALDRPFYFIVVLWGERFRNYFLDFCLASALSPGNMPALQTSRRSKFLIATRPEDWAAMRDTPMFRLLERYVEPVYIEIPPCPPGRSGYQHMSIGHRIACEMAHRDKAYAMVLTPDCMLSDGSVARLQELAHGGTATRAHRGVAFRRGAVSWPSARSGRPAGGKPQRRRYPARHHRAADGLCRRQWVPQRDLGL